MTRLPLMVLLLALLCGCTSETSAPAASPARPSILILSIDTLRSDRLSAYGYDKARTPAIDRFRAESILFRHAFSPVPQTLPAHASLFTGQMPWELGIHDNLGYSLASSTPTLASQLRSAGYRTGGAVSAWVLRDETGIGRGFEFWSDELDPGDGERTISQRSGDRTVEQALSWIDSVGSDPFFAFVHIYEPHGPWQADEAFEHPYDAEVARADRIAGRLFDALRERGRWDDTMVVLVSDHGEGLGDHGEQEHGVLLYREALQVPLIVKLPGGRHAGESRDELVSIADLYPTLLGAAGVQHRSPAHDLLDPAPRAARHLLAQSHYGRLHMGWSSLQSVMTPTHHLIQGRFDEMFDWRADAAETTDVRESERRAYAALRKQGEALARTAALTPPSDVSEEDRRRLESLGYLGSSVASGSADSLPDPRQRIGAIQELRYATGALESGDFERAAKLARELTRTEPQFGHAWAVLGSASRALGREADAIQALRKHLALSPSNASTALALSELYAGQGEWREAIEHARLALRSEQEGAETQLLRIALASRDSREAERLASKAIEDPRAGTPRLLSASQVFRAAREPANELLALDRAVEQSTTLPRDVHFRRGELLLELGRVAEAERAFRSEVTAHSDHAPAWGNLVMLVAAQSRRDEALSLLAQAERSAPGPEMRSIARDARTILSSSGSR